MTAFSIRVARPADHSALAELLAELLDKTSLTLELKSVLNTSLLRLLSTPGTTMLVAEQNKDFLGFISLWTYWGLFDDAPTGIIDHLILKRGWQESSIPQALLEQALGACQAMGCSSLRILPSENAVPKEVLEEFGFEDLGKAYSLNIYQ